jgi:bifunctional DNA-binding transcriptional regulator/antitoxin component of YhaV-PrlF toxin-antitoxin module
MSHSMTLTSKAQFTFNKGLLEHLGVKAGDQISIRKMPNGKIEIEAKKNEITEAELFPFLRKTLKTDKKFSLEEIQEAIAQSYVDAGVKGLK